MHQIWLEIWRNICWSWQIFFLNFVNVDTYVAATLPPPYRFTWRTIFRTWWHCVCREIFGFLCHTINCNLAAQFVGPFDATLSALLPQL
jgi:hypothetical protein